jgi:hypothetical protein
MTAMGPAQPRSLWTPPRLTPLRLLATLPLLTAGCTDQGLPPDEAPVDPVLLASSFETGGAPSLDGWLVANPAGTSVERDAPAGGGSWAVKLVSNGSPTNTYLYAPLTRLESGDTLLVECFIRALGQAGGGAVELRVGPTVYSPWRKKVVSYDTLWTRVSITDTVSLAGANIVWLVLTSLDTEVVRRDGLFDLVSVTRLR